MARTSRTEHYKREVSRVEGFSDAVFAFAITLLVVSLEAPKTFHELMAVVRALPAFAVCFALLFQVWWRHYRFFRKYDLEDGYVIALTGLLLFVVLFYVYPLKFLWSVLLSPVASGGHSTEEILTLAQVPMLFVIYGTGVLATFGILALLYAHAYRRRDQLELSAVEVLDARVDIYRNIGVASVGLVSMTLAVILGAVAPRTVGIAGFFYAVIGFVEWGLGEYQGRERRKLLAVASTADTSTA